MNKLKLIWILVSLTAISVLSANAQSQSDMRLNELLVTNTSDFQDDFGQHSAWFELFNISYGTVDIGGCYLSNDPNNLKKYIIPKADVLTKIPPRQHVLFWADNQPFRGTFHVNFTLAESDTIYFVASDGRTILDKIFVPKDLEDNVSYGRSQDGIGEWEVRQWTSPSTNNSGVDAESKSAIMKKTDPHGVVITIVAMSVVFCALIILYVLFKFIGNVAIRTLQKRSDETTEKTGTTKTDVAEASAETYAAIGV
ncbi:MAG: OadG family protein, partial [Bacteroidales bacterium]|nr:OadG family protein [Bacteroidales bacterium]